MMSATHGGPITLKPIGEVAEFLKTLIPANMPGSYALKPMFSSIAGEEVIRRGVIALRDFLYVFCERLISDGQEYAKPPKTPKSMADYPFLHYVTNLMVDIGYHGKLADGGESLLVEGIPVFRASVDENGKVTKPKIPVSNQVECLRFLALCGFEFGGVDLMAKALNVTEAQALTVSYPNDPSLLTGLKAMAVADMELRGRRYWNDNNLLRCDYRLLKAEDTDILDVLKDFLHPLPENIRGFALRLHKRYTDMGMTCVPIIDDQHHFAYSFVKHSKRDLTPRDIYYLRVWEFALSLRYGYCLVIRAKKTDEYADVIAKFPLRLREMIAKGYGCDRKLRGERCQGGCQGFRIPLDGSIIDASCDIETWLDNEMPPSLKK